MGSWTTNFPMRPCSFTKSQAETEHRLCTIGHPVEASWKASHAEPKEHPISLLTVQSYPVSKLKQDHNRQSNSSDQLTGLQPGCNQASRKASHAGLAELPGQQADAGTKVERHEQLSGLQPRTLRQKWTSLAHKPIARILRTGNCEDRHRCQWPLQTR